jgi:calmodulin
MSSSRTSIAPRPVSSSSRSASRPGTRSIVPVTSGDVHTAFNFFDSSKRGVLTVDDLKARLCIFYPNLSAAELQAMMMGKEELTEADLYDLLSSHNLSNYDPVAEAFKVR